MEAHATPFLYSSSQFNSCASFLNNNNSNGLSSCRHLFLQHASHYHRPSLTVDEDLFWNTTSISNNDAIKEAPTKRIRAFISSVQFVHAHNSQDGHHKVALNRFSDLSEEDLPLFPPKTDGTTSSTTSSSNKGGMDWFQELQSNFLTIDSEERIMELSRKIIRSNKNQQHGRTSTKNTHPQQSILYYYQTITSYFSNRYLGIFDSWWWIGERHDNDNSNDAKSTTARIEEHTRNHGSSHNSGSSSDVTSKQQERSFVVDKRNEMDGIEDITTNNNDKEEDRWERYLNWSTEDNPDGVGIVHDAMDQGLCGSCWAVSALGSLEASIVRNMAYMAYEDSYQHTPSSQFRSKSDLRSISISSAQTIELSSLQKAMLSVQELVDCDTRYDQGCSGGNPLLAFYFLHRFGVTSSSNYPYTGKENTCQYHKVDEPIATVETWGILTPDHENNMEKVLRYIGPVAVGLVGADPSFLAYKEGIFSVKGGKCENGEADHAMLIVGYGEEENKDGSTTKYWIARNSWGTGWGENGYIRMERIGGRKGSRGVCEIARSPSVALGGMFTKDVELSVNTRDMHHGRHGRDHLSSSNPIVRRESSQIGSVIHRIRARLGFFEEGIMMSTLNGSENESKTNEALPLSEVLGIMSLLCLLTYVFRKQRRRQSRHRTRIQSENEFNSSASNLSISCLCSDSIGDELAKTCQEASEETSLLDGCSDRVAYT